MNLLKIDEAELKNQVDNYQTLKITRSYRKCAVLIVSAFLGFSLLLSLFSSVGGTTTGVIMDIVIYLPVLFFVYKGHRWAIVLLMAMWTLSAGYQYYKGGGNDIPVIIWWFILMPFFWKVLRVENERRKEKK